MHIFYKYFTVNIKYDIFTSCITIDLSFLLLIVNQIQLTSILVFDYIAAFVGLVDNRRFMIYQITTERMEFIANKY